MHQELKNHPEVIGQFGVGFYSAFIVADSVTVHTQKAGTHQGILWESDGQGTYTIEEAPREKGHGTTITLHLKSPAKEEDEAHQDFTDFWTLKSIIKKYSDYIPYPIKMRRILKDETPEAKVEDEILNSQKALWLRPVSEITQEEYQEFYRHLSHDWAEPLKTIHYKAEGTMEFTALLYVPSQKPMDYDYRDRKIGLSLYVKRVFIKSDCEELLPPYLRFIKGLVDSDDLSLNVSREILQQDRQVVRIKKALTNKILSSLKEYLENDRSNYEKFWVHFGATLKEGIALEPGANEKLQDLILFQSSHSKGQWISLKEYLDRMKPDQKAIYFVTGESLSHIENSPYLEKLKKKDFEVLFMTDRVDPFVVSNLPEYQGKSLQSVTAENLDLTSEAEKASEAETLKQAQEKYKPLLEAMKEVLKNQVQEVRVTSRLTESPVCLTSATDSTSAHMERLLQSMGQTVPKSLRILEINPNHPLYDKMLNASRSQQEEWSEILYQQALLNEGSTIENPHLYSKRIANLMLQSV